MKESERLGLLSLIVRELNGAESWTGRMHIHKLVYFAQEILGLQSNYDFVLYQRGPYSFDLDADIRSLRSIGGVEIRPAPPYGPKYVTTPLGNTLIELSPTDEETEQNVGKLAQLLGPRPARELELLATTYYVLDERDRSDDAIVERVLSLKPQFGKDEAQKALVEVRQLQKEFTRAGPV
jgi:uncharacterized protein YwgA